MPIATYMGSFSGNRRRMLVGAGFAALSVAGAVLLGKRLTHTSWPLQRAHVGLVLGAVALYFVSYVFRALGWQKLFPADARPGRARCLPACGAAAATRVEIPFLL